MRSRVLLTSISLLFSACFTPQIIGVTGTNKSSIIAVGNVQPTNRYGVLPIPFTLKSAQSKSLTFTLSVTGSDSTVSDGVDYSSVVSAPVTLSAGQTSGSFYLSLISNGQPFSRLKGTVNLKITPSDSSLVPQTFSVTLPATGSSAPLLSGVQQFATYYHTCAVMTGGGVKCWGDNSYGQLGDGTTTQRSTPVDVVGLAGPAQMVAVGAYTTCVLLVSGSVQCWGYNGYGEVGDGTTVNKTAPVTVATASNVSSISMGIYHTCALLTPSNGLQCWGYNLSGNLGDGTLVSKSVPTNVSGLAAGVSSIAAGSYHTCALLSDGSVRCWGGGSNGTIGDGAGVTRSSPTTPTGLTAGTVSAITSNYLGSCALLIATGGVQCWGNNSYGQIGDGTFTNRLVPTNVTGLGAGVSALPQSSPEAYHQCAILPGNNLQCWGYNGSGNIPNGSILNITTPAAATQYTGTIQSIALSWIGSCILDSAQNLQCFGGNTYGQFGDGKSNSIGFPVDPAGFTSGVTKVSGYFSHSCAVMSNGQLKCWGYNEFGELGDGTTNNNTSAVTVPLASNAVSVAVGYNHTCALLDTGAVQCWGKNNYGQVGDNTVVNKSSPVTVIGGGVSAIAAGWVHTCAMLSNGSAQCWGYNGDGEVGDNTIVNKLVPTAVSGLGAGTITSISVGQSHTCVILTAGSVKCWGYNAYGQIGDNTVAIKKVPTAPIGVAGTVRQIVAGGYFTCALLNSGSTQCWGDNTWGEIGDGTTIQRNTAVNSTNAPSGINTLAAFDTGLCALMNDSSVSCWGGNAKNELANGTNQGASGPLPATVTGLSTGVSSIACGQYECYAILTNGALKGWGNNDYFQLGVGTTNATSSGTVAY